MGMTDVSDKPIQKRIAVAQGKILLQRKTLEAIEKGNIKKGNPLVFAEAAAFHAVKKTPDLIAHCHQIPIEKIDVDFKIEEDGIRTTVTVKTSSKTGVEMDALVGLSMALVTIFDMVKYMEKDETGNYPEARISDVHVEHKEKK